MHPTSEDKSRSVVDVALEPMCTAEHDMHMTCMSALLLSRSDEGLFSRDLFVINTCLAMDIPVATVIGGGYAASRDVLARRHAIVFAAAFQAWRAYGHDRDKWRSERP